MTKKWKRHAGGDTEFIKQEKNNAIKRCIRAGVLSIKDYRDEWRKRKDVMTLMRYKSMLLRQIGARSFLAFCAIFDCPINEEPIYVNYYKRIDEERSKAVHLQIKKKAAQRDNQTEIVKEYDEQIKKLFAQQKIRHKQSYLLIARGLRKTTYGIVFRAAFLWISDNMIFNRPPTIAITGEDKEKAIHTMNAIKSLLKKDLMKSLYKNLVEMDVDRQEMVRFDVRGDYEMREAHLAAFNYFGDFESYHFTYMMVDDPETWDNTRTPEGRDKIKNKHDDMTFLDDHSIFCRIEGVGTAHRATGLYPHIEDKESAYVEKHPVEKYDKDGNITLNFQGWNNRYSREGAVEALKGETTPAKYEAQINQKYMREGESARIMTSMPVFIHPYPTEKDRAKKHFWTGVLSDPAVSTKQGKTGMNTLLCVTITNDMNIYVVDGHLHKGVHQPSAHINNIIDLAMRNQATEVIMETIAAQEYMAKHLQEELSRRKIHLGVTYHRHFQSKEAHYRNFLEPLAHQNKLFVADGSKVLRELRRQLLGESPKQDCVDCLSFLKTKNFNFSTAITQKTNEEKAVERIKEIRRKKRKQRRKYTIGRKTKWY